MTVTGRSGPDSWMEYLDIIDLTLNNRPVAEFIVTKLWEYFVYTNPPVEVVDEILTGVQAIAVDPETGLVTGGADPRRDGLALGP